MRKNGNHSTPGATSATGIQGTGTDTDRSTGRGQIKTAGRADQGSIIRILAHELNAQGFRIRMGKPFTESAVSTALDNPFYSGKFVYHRNRSDEEVRDVPDDVPQRPAVWDASPLSRRSSHRAGVRRAGALLHLAGWRVPRRGAQGPGTEGPKPDHTLELKRIEGAMANLRKQHLWGVITDDAFKAEFQPLERQRQALASPAPTALTPNMDRAAKLLRDLPVLWQHPGVTPEQRRDLTREVFEELRLREGSLVAVRPRPTYAPLFAYSLWRGQVVGGTCPS